MKNKSFLIGLTIVGLFLLAFMYLKEAPPSDTKISFSQPQESGFRVTPSPNSLLIKPHSIVKGPFSAKVVLVEFLDPECEACAAMYPIVKKISQEFESELRVVIRYMTFHKNSKLVANILEGARAENKYWESLELLFQTQDQWANHQNPNPELIPQILKPLKMNMTQIMADAKAGKYDRQIAEDTEDGRMVGVTGTPTFFVNGHKVLELGYDSLRSEITAQLQKSSPQN